jgi:hypothetical protein
MQFDKATPVCWAEGSPIEGPIGHDAPLFEMDRSRFMIKIES